MWYYLTSEDYRNIIKKINNPSLKYKLFSQYKSKRPMLTESYLKLKKKYGEHR